jgi:hypothetical protein
MKARIELEVGTRPEDRVTLEGSDLRALLAEADAWLAARTTRPP